MGKGDHPMTFIIEEIFCQNSPHRLCACDIIMIPLGLGLSHLGCKFWTQSCQLLFYTCFGDGSIALAAHNTVWQHSMLTEKVER